MRFFNLFTGVLLFFTLNANAQIGKGSTFVGGDISFSTEKGTGNNNTDYQTLRIYFSPVFGRVVKENLLVGSYLLFSFVNNDVALDFNDLKQWNYGAGLFARWYTPIARTKFNLFLQVASAAEYSKVKQAFNTVDKIEQKTFAINLGVNPGISYSLSRKLQLEAGFNSLFGLRYFHRKTTSGIINPVLSNVNGLSLYANAENLTQFYVGFRLFILKQ